MVNSKHQLNIMEKYFSYPSLSGVLQSLPTVTRPTYTLDSRQSTHRYAHTLTAKSNKVPSHPRTRETTHDNPKFSVSQNRNILLDSRPHTLKNSKQQQRFPEPLNGPPVWLRRLREEDFWVDSGQKSLFKNNVLHAAKENSIYWFFSSLLLLFLWSLLLCGTSF